MNNKINIAPNWKTTSEIIIMVLQNKKLDANGFQDTFEMIREMGSKLDLANEKLKKLGEKS